MKATTLNEKQKNKTLSGKIQKAKQVVKIKKGSVRNILSSSVPRISLTAKLLPENEEIKLDKVLSQIFQYQPLKVPKWSDLKKHTKAERRALKKEGKIIHPLRDYIVLGFNEVTRAMENRTATVILLAEDIDPVLLTNHFKQCCALYKIPLITVRNLRDILKKCFGFSSMAMALKEVPKYSALYGVYKVLESSFPIEWMIKHINEAVADLSHENTSPVIKETSNETTKNDDVVQREVNNEENNMKESEVYLYRNYKKKRCFVPTANKNINKTIIPEFIAFGQEENKINSTAPELQLKDLVIKKIKPNVKRRQT